MTQPTSKRSHLHMHLDRAGARWREIGSWLIPSSFGGDADNAAAGVTLFDASHFTRIRVTGADRADYLNRRLSQKTDDLQSGQTCRAALLDATGKMLADMQITARTRDFLILAPPWRGEHLAAELDKYVFSEDIAFEDITAHTVALFISGPQAATLLHASGFETPRADSASCETKTPEGATVTLFRSTWALHGFCLVADAEDGDAVFQRLSAGLSSSAGRLIGHDEWNHRRILAGIPFWGHDFDQDTIPLEADLLDAVHFDKGCYPGQETIARISNLGHPARKLVRLAMTSDRFAASIEDAPLLDERDQVVGTITSATRDGATRTLRALAMVKWSARRPGTELRIQGEDVATTVRVVPAPDATDA